MLHYDMVCIALGARSSSHAGLYNVHIMFLSTSDFWIVVLFFSNCMVYRESNSCMQLLQQHKLRTTHIFMPKCPFQSFKSSQATPKLLYLLGVRYVPIANEIRIQLNLKKNRLIYSFHFTLLGCLAGILGQSLISTGACGYFALNYISLAFVSAATLVSLLLPNVSQSIYFHRRKEQTVDLSVPDVVEKDAVPETIYANASVSVSKSSELENEPQHSTFKSVYHLLWIDFTLSYSNAYMLKWSLWWAFAMCGYFQILNYIQPLWWVKFFFFSNL